jgi:hypothetical protein
MLLKRYRSPSRAGIHLRQKIHRNIQKYMDGQAFVEMSKSLKQRHKHQMTKYIKIYKDI